VAATTVGASVAEFEAVRTYSNLILAAATHKLQASTHNAENFNVLAFGRGPDVTNLHDRHRAQDLRQGRVRVTPALIAHV
jgi:hypothetical protein